LEEHNGRWVTGVVNWGKVRRVEQFYERARIHGGPEHSQKSPTFENCKGDRRKNRELDNTTTP